MNNLDKGDFEMGIDKLSTADKNLMFALQYILIRINKHEITKGNSPTYDIDIGCSEKPYKIDHVSYATLLNLYKILVGEV